MGDCFSEAVSSFLPFSEPGRKTWNITIIILVRYIYWKKKNYNVIVYHI